MRRISILFMVLILTLVLLATGCSKKAVYKRETEPPTRERPRPEPKEEKEMKEPEEVPVLPEKKVEKETPPMPEEELKLPPVEEGKVIEDFEDISDWSFRGYPENVVIGAIATSAAQVKAGMFSGMLTYDFTGAADRSAAAYMKTNKLIPMGIDEISVWVYGNGSGHWLRARFVDARGIKFVASITRDLNWSGEWRKLTIKTSDIIGYEDGQETIPYELPLTLEYIYVYVAPDKFHDTGTIYFDNLYVK